MLHGLLAVIRARPLLWLGLTLGFVAAYHALLLGMMVLRFGYWPNYFRSYDIVEAWRLVIAGTPSWRDAASILLSEPLLEAGYLSPQWRIAEWSLMILPQQLAQVTLLGFLLATFALLHIAAARARCRAPSPGEW